MNRVQIYRVVSVYVGWKKGMLYTTISFRIAYTCEIDYLNKLSRKNFLTIVDLTSTRLWRFAYGSFNCPSKIVWIISMQCNASIGLPIYPSLLAPLGIRNGSYGPPDIAICMDDRLPFKVMLRVL